jgi:ABC-type multidrug transport system permease subunit
MSNKEVICATTEYVTFDPPSGQTCATYMQTYISTAGGYLSNPNATSDCSFCAMSSTNTFLASFDIYYKDRYRAFGLMWVYILFNAAAGVALYWLVRVVSGIWLSPRRRGFRMFCSRSVP